MAETLRLPAAKLRAQRETPASEALAPANPEPDGNGIEPTIYRFILRHSLRDQIVLIILTFSSFPFLYYSLDLPKTIVNRAIGGKKFPQELFGLSLDQIPYLLALCGLFLLFVCFNGAFKYAINVIANRTGERMLRRLRFELYFRLLRFPLGHFKKVSSAEIIPMITAEVEPLGGFVGEAFSLPAFQGGQLLTYLLFMFIQDPVLGAAAVALYPIQGYVIPKLQRKVNRLGKQRVRTIRVLADRVGESAAGMAEIRSNDAARYQLTQIAHILGTIFEIRYQIVQRKFFAKFLNNFMNQLTPFFFFSIGGYLVIKGSLSFGALVAVLAAYKDLASPWKELLDYYQRKEDARIKYEQIVEQFQPDGMVDPRLQLAKPEDDRHLSGDLVVSNVSLVEDERIRIIDGVSFKASLEQSLAIIGQSGSGKTELGLVLARLVEPATGRITIGGADLATLPGGLVGQRIGYSGPNPHFFATSLRENLFYGLKRHPVRAAEYEPLRLKRRQWSLDEARRAGNIDLDIEADWVDYAAAGASSEAELIDITIGLLRRLDLDEDVYGFGLRGRIDPARQPEIAEDLLEARRALARRLELDKITHLVERFDATRYNANATMAENLLFGTPVGPAFEPETLASNTYVLKVLDKVGLREDLVRMGEQAAETMVELFADLPPGHEFFEQFSFISADALPEYQAILGRIAKSGRDSLKPDDRTRLLALPFKLIIARHRLDLLDERMQARILEARRVFAAELPDELRPQIEFFDSARYNAAATLQDNVLFGKIAYGEAEAPTRIPALVTSVLDELGLRDKVMAVGLNFNVGTAGGRLSVAQRQKASIARALLKRPDLLVLNEAASGLDGQAQLKVMQGVKDATAGRGLVWILHRASLARQFDRVLVMSGGRLVDDGPPDRLEKSSAAFKILVAAE